MVSSLAVFYTAAMTVLTNSSGQKNIKVTPHSILQTVTYGYIHSACDIATW